MGAPRPAQLLNIVSSPRTSRRGFLTATASAALLRSAARGAGALDYFPRETGSGFIDDHTPFLRAGVPAIDLIDPYYDGHSTSDRLGRLSRRSIDAVGESLISLAMRMLLCLGLAHGKGTCLGRGRLHGGPRRAGRARTGA
jgi:hypothetical protein